MCGNVCRWGHRWCELIVLVVCVFVCFLFLTLLLLFDDVVVVVAMLPLLLGCWYWCDVIRRCCDALASLYFPILFLFFLLLLRVLPHNGGGPSKDVTLTGYPPPILTWDGGTPVLNWDGVPPGHPELGPGWGLPPSGRMGYPPQEGWGTSPVRKDGVPPKLGRMGVPPCHQEGWGYPLPPPLLSFPYEGNPSPPPRWWIGGTAPTPTGVDWHTNWKYCLPPSFVCGR